MSEIWVIKKSAPVTLRYSNGSETFSGDFISNNTTFLSLTVNAYFKTDRFYAELRYNTEANIIPVTDKITTAHTNVGDLGTTWEFTDEAYRTLKFDTAPTGDFLAWLQSNAEKQPDPEYLTRKSELMELADAIRAKGGTSAQLVYPTGFVSAIQAIQTGVTPQLIVTTSVGAAVTATKGSKTVSGTAGADGTCTLELSEAGEWSVTSSLNGNSKTQTVLIGTQTADIRLFEPVFANNSWETIIAACRSGDVPDSWAIGNSKNMTINGTDYQIDIIGKNHDDYADGSGKAPLTFQMHNSYGTAYAMNSTSTNAGGWKECAMRKTHLPAILALMPAEVQSGIREVSKITLSRDTSGIPTMDTTSDKLFLLSEVEVFNSTENSASGEGSQYAYYGASGSTVKTLNGGRISWWLRSPMSTSDYSFCASSAGGAPTNLNATDERGAAFAFCF